LSLVECTECGFCSLQMFSPCGKQRRLVQDAAVKRATDTE
jgi:hypothetical protein